MKYKNFTDILINPPKQVTGFLPNFIWNKKTSQKEIFLTFDDGPVPGLTPKVLDILDLYGAKATFFCVGENVKKYPEIYQEILDRGHKTGNHTYNHLNGFKTNSTDYIKNAEKSEKYIKTDLFRPPYGKMKYGQISALKKKYKLILWDVLTMDYSQSIGHAECFDNVKRFTKPGSIVVFHDNYKAEKNMIPTLTETLIQYSKMDYSFSKLDSKYL